MNKIKTVLIEAREGQDEESSRASVLTKASKEQKPDRRQPKAAVAGTDDEKGSKALDTKGMPGPTAKAKPKAKAKASGKGDKEPNTSGPKALAGEVAAASAGDHDPTKEHHAEPQSLESDVGDDVGDDVGGDALVHEHEASYVPFA